MRHIDGAFDVWRRRNVIRWSQDLSIVSIVSVNDG
jgi:hypothetical protein